MTNSLRRFLARAFLLRRTTGHRLVVEPGGAGCRSGSSGSFAHGLSFFMSKYIATDRAPLAVGAILICSSVSAYDSAAPSR